MRFLNILCLTWLFVMVVSQLTLAEEINAKVIHAVKVESSELPMIDGKLDEECWKKAGKATDFIQFQPVPGGKPKEPTNVYVLFDKENLYIGFECFKENPDQIIATQTRRDSEFFNDDYVEVFLDTYRDRRNCYSFAVNYLGAQSDRRIANEGSTGGREGPFDDRSRAWDCAWEAKTARIDKGWTAEMAIPFSELRFKKKGGDTWGINFWRSNEEFNEGDTWADVGEMQLCVSRFGYIEGLTPEDFVVSRPLELKPYATIKPQVSPEQEVKPDAGLDIRYPSSTITADFTLNPDYAQIEADPERINLEDVEMRLPEKRPFFQEGMELFQTPIELFYTRRVGVKDLMYGAKAVGKLGSYNIAFLGCKSDDSKLLFSIDSGIQSYLNSLNSGNVPKSLLQEFENNGVPLLQSSIVLTRETDSRWQITDKDNVYFVKKEGNSLNVYGEEDEYGIGGEAENEEKNNYLVFRTQRDIGTNSSIGILGVNKQRADGYNRAGAVDFNITLPSNIRLMGQYARSWLPKESDSAMVISLNRRTKSLSFELAGGDIGRDFDVESGYIPRTDRRGFRIGSGYEYRRDAKIFKMLHGGVHYERLENHDGIKTNDSRGFEIMVNLGNFFIFAEPSWYQHVDMMDESISYTDKIIFFFTGWSPPRWVSFRSPMMIGKQENKKTFFIGPGVTIMPTQKLKFDFGMERLDREGEELMLNSRFTASYQFSQRMFFRTTFGMTRDNTQSIFALYSWEFRPESNLFLVYTDNKQADDVERMIFFKITYLLKWRIF